MLWEAKASPGADPKQELCLRCGRCLTGGAARREDRRQSQEERALDMRSFRSLGVFLGAFDFSSEFGFEAIFEFRLFTQPGAARGLRDLSSSFSI